MPAGILLFVGEQAPTSGEWRSPCPGDDWPIEHVRAPDEAEARAELQAGELGGVQRRVHSLKSSAGNFGARALQELAFRAERLAAENRAEALPAALDAIGAAFERVRVYLEKR